MRDEKDLDRIRRHILNNQARWWFDPENPARVEGPRPEDWPFDDDPR